MVKYSDKPSNIPDKLWDANVALHTYSDSEFGDALNIKIALERIIEYLIEKESK